MKRILIALSIVLLFAGTAYPLSWNGYYADSNINAGDVVVADR